VWGKPLQITGGRGSERGPGGLKGGPGPRYVVRILIFSRSALAEGPGKIVSPGPVPAPGSPPNISRVIKSRRIRWAGHVARMGDRRGFVGET
jgi:hypothetical protein